MLELGKHEWWVERDFFEHKISVESNPTEQVIVYKFFSHLPKG